MTPLGVGTRITITITLDKDTNSSNSICRWAVSVGGSKISKKRQRSICGTERGRDQDHAVEIPRSGSLGELPLPDAK